MSRARARDPGKAVRAVSWAIFLALGAMALWLILVKYDIDNALFMLVPGMLLLTTLTWKAPPTQAEVTAALNGLPAELVEEVRTLKARNRSLEALRTLRREGGLDLATAHAILKRLRT